MFCNNKKVEKDWLEESGENYMKDLTKCFCMQLQDEQNQEPEQIVDLQVIQNLCLSKKEILSNLHIQKTGSIIGSVIQRIGKFNNSILQQIENQKITKSFPNYTSVEIEEKVADSKEWHAPKGDVARILLGFEKHKPIYFYVHDHEQAVKWKRYLLLQPLIKKNEQQLIKCIQYCLLETEARQKEYWIPKIFDNLSLYTNKCVLYRKSHAQLNKQFIQQMHFDVLKYCLILKWRVNAQKQKEIYIIQSAQRREEELEQEKLRIQQLEEEERRKAEHKRRRQELMENIKKYIRPLQEDMKIFYTAWLDRSKYISENRPNKFKLGVKHMLIQSDIEMIRPQLEIKFISERSPYTMDFEQIKVINGQEYYIDQKPYLIFKLLAQMGQQTRRNYISWAFKDGLLGLCGVTQLTVDRLGFQDYLDLQVKDTINSQTQTEILRVQMQDLTKYTLDGRSCWFPLSLNSSKLFIEIDINDPTNLDPLFYDTVEFLELNQVLRKIVIKIIEQRSPIPIVETIKFTLEPDRYQQAIQQLYQRYYLENIGLQESVHPHLWFEKMQGKEKIVKGICEILKRNYLEFVDQENNQEIYKKMNQLQGLRLPLLKDVEDYVNKLEVKLVKQIQTMLISFLIYCNLKQIQLNVGFLSTLFNIGNKFISLTHYHFIKTISIPVFGNIFDQEAQAFWLFVSFSHLLINLNYPISKADQIFSPQEIVLTYIEVLQKDIIMHCKNNAIPIENVLYEILANMFTNIVGSMPLYNIFDIIISKNSPHAHQIVLIILIEELGDKLFFTTNRNDFFKAIQLQAQLMDKQQILDAYDICESNLNRIISVKEIIPNTIIQKQGDQDFLANDD